MDLRDSPEQASFRAGLREWLAANEPDADEHAWACRLHEAGYAGLTWPVAYGGRGLESAYRSIYLEELARAGAPDHLGIIGLNMAGPTLIAHAAEAHKRERLPRLLSGEEIWCQAFSEPGSGFDLASLSTRAERRGEVFVVEGQKVWSSFAHIADWCLLLARSEPGSRGHDGLSYLIVDMRTPGIEVRPMRQLTGEAEFNEIFFTGAVVPRENLLGEEGAGWRVAMTTLLHERGTLGFALVAQLESAYRRLVVLARERGVDDPLVRDGVAREWIELQALRITALRAVAGGGVPGPEASVTKLHWSLASQRLTRLALELLGPEAQLLEASGWPFAQLRSRGNTIEAGTTEILRSIVAERVLGLPRSR